MNVGMFGEDGQSLMQGYSSLGKDQSGQVRLG